MELWCSISSGLSCGGGEPSTSLPVVFTLAIFSCTGKALWDDELKFASVLLVQTEVSRRTSLESRMDEHWVLSDEPPEVRKEGKERAILFKDVSKEHDETDEFVISKRSNDEGG